MIQPYLDRLPLVAILRGVTPGRGRLDRSERSSTRASSSSRSRSTRREPLESIRAAAASDSVRDPHRRGHGHDARQVRRVARAGGRLIVMPHGDGDVVRAAKEAGLVCIPGIATPTEAFAALANGADALKLFPAELLTPAVLQIDARRAAADDALPPRRRDITGRDGGVCCRRRGGFRPRLRAVPSRRRRRSRVAANARDFVDAWRRLRSAQRVTTTRADCTLRIAPPCGASHLRSEFRISTPEPMKITKLTTFIVPPRWCFLKIETDEGITGWGEPVLEGRAHTVAAAVDGAGRLSRRQGSVADRGPLDGALSRRLLSRRRRAHERPRRHRPGAVGHQGQGARRPGAPAARRAACAIASGSIRGSAATGRPTPPRWRASAARAASPR